MLHPTEFKGKRILIMGLGLLGRGVGDAKFLAACGAELTITDLKSAEELAPSLDALKNYPEIRYTLGEHTLEDFKNQDIILKAAGVPKNSPYLLEAQKNNIPIKMSASWFAELSEVPIIGVTGTRGKSTTTHMIDGVLKAAGKNVLLGGNIRGVSTLALLEKSQENALALFELDSWQLQGFGDAKRSPEVAVMTTFFPDHMNYYKNDMDAYLADKANIFLYQNEANTLILGTQCAGLVEKKYAGKIRSRFIKAGAEDLPKEWTLLVPGEHNRYNAALARETACAVGIGDDIIQQALAEFPGVPGRLELIREINGVKFYNDTTATTPDATMAAISALKNHGIILIMGGSDKGLDMTPLISHIQKQVKKIVMLAGTGTERIHESFKETSVFDNIEAAVAEAASAASTGDVVLLSPAFASFGMFKNEFDRGDQFTAAVKKL